MGKLQSSNINLKMLLNFFNIYPLYLYIINIIVQYKSLEYKLCKLSILSK